MVELSLVINVVNEGGILGLGAGISDHRILLTVTSRRWWEVWSSIGSIIRHVSLVAASNTGSGSGDMRVIGGEVCVVCTATLWRRLGMDCDPCCTCTVARERGREWS